MKTGKVMGLDWGSKRIGVAISDPGRSIAASSFTYNRKNSEEDLSYLRRLVRDKEITLIVVGMPITMAGEEGEVAEQVREFIGRLTEEVDVPVDVIDERLTSAEAERVLLSSDVSRRKRKEHRDKLAATLILQRYLDRENS
ncbi:Holliday junction resolvase RuvX [Candidatus Bipolaricaulota bacterium]|nr:Holliday junction resolvase RuvX [Candidatus Bipolaricaulota bacterium]